MTPLGVAAGVLGGWLILAALGATVPHRLKRVMRLADPGENPIPLEDLGEYTAVQQWLPPVPQRDYLRDQPAEILVGAELDGRFYGIIAREWYL